jgi:glycine oxidase
MIGRAERFENLYLNAGHFRNGLVLAPASARLLTELMLGRETFIDPLPYRPR